MSNYYIGIDLGTSAMKGILTDEQGKIVRQATATYDVIYPQNGWTEQNPSDWIVALNEVLAELLCVDKDCAICNTCEGLTGESGTSNIAKYVKGISFGGQMHGLVVLDKHGEVVRPCILWNDGRTEKQTAYLNEVVGKQTLSDLTGNIAFAGFTAPKLLWLRENEPDNFANADKIMLPKDYLAYYLSGVVATDYSDASGTLLLDVKNKRWSQKMANVCGISLQNLPKLHESYDVIGTVKSDIATFFGLTNDVKVVIGAGDNAAAAIGTGTVNDGDCNVSLGTSGTIFVCQDKFSVDGSNALHSFAHANGKWHLMGCILSAASCRKWWLEDILETCDYATDEQQLANVDSGNVIFLPYLSGERSPHNDVNAKGAFVGLTATTTRAQMSRAVMEGVAFAIRDCYEIAKINGLKIMSTNLCGGGARSAVWRQIFADVLGIPVHILATEQGPSYGAAILAMVGCGAYRDVSEATKQIVSVKATVFPDKNNKKYYDKKYTLFKKLYPVLKEFSGVKIP